jgi:hypothetical protein
MKHPTNELVRLIGGDLPLSDATPVREHLHRCIVCQAEYDRLEALEAQLHALPRLIPAPDFVAQVQTRIAHAPARLARPRWWVPALAMLIGALVLVPSGNDLLAVLGASTASLPVWSDLNGWLFWLQQLGMHVTLALIVGGCVLTVGCLLVIGTTVRALPALPPGSTIQDRVRA